MVVHAGADQAELITIRHPGEREAAVGEIDVEIFDLGGPVLRQAELGADAKVVAIKAVAANTALLISTLHTTLTAAPKRPDRRVCEPDLRVTELMVLSLRFIETFALMGC